MNQQQTEHGKKELWIFLAVAFGLTYLMGVPLAICQKAGIQGDVFPTAQMFYPAAGVMLGALLVRGRLAPLTKRFYGVYLLVTVALVAMCLAAWITRDTNWYWYMIANYTIIIASVLAWVLLLTERKEKRKACGLRWHGGLLKPIGLILLFILLKAASVFAVNAASGDLSDYLAYWMTSTPWRAIAILLPNFFLSFLPFLGEEYGWRYYLQPRMQQRFGARRGVLLLGVAWGLWHLPLNLFYYSPETPLLSILGQLITCISLGVFFAFAYLKTNNIWLPVILHFLNNNLILVLAGTADLSNQVFVWSDMALGFVINLVLFMPYLFSKVFNTPAKLQEQLHGQAVEQAPERITEQPAE